MLFVVARRMTRVLLVLLAALVLLSRFRMLRWSLLWRSRRWLGLWRLLARRRFTWVVLVFRLPSSRRRTRLCGVFLVRSLVCRSSINRKRPLKQTGTTSDPESKPRHNISRRNVLAVVGGEYTYIITKESTDHGI